MKTVGEILAAKGREVWTIGPDVTVYEALKMMAEKEVGALVVEGKGRVIGVISERDYARKIILKGKFSKSTPVKEIMSLTVTTVGPDRSVDECMALMTDKRIRHLPVVDNGRLAGIISIGDLVKSIISEQKFLIQNLEEYIGGAPTVR